MGLSRNKVIMTKIAISIVVLISLFLFLRQTDFAQVAHYLVAIGYGYVWIVIVTLLAMLMGTISWRYTFKEDTIGRISFVKLFVIRLVGENIGLLNPSNIIGGDAYKGYQLSKEGIAYHESTSSLILSRMIMMVTQILTFIISGVLFIAFIDSSRELNLIIGGSILLLIFLSGMFYLLLRYGLVSQRLQHLFQRYGWYKLIYKLKKIYVQLRSFYRDNRIRFFKAIGFNMLNWIVGSLEFWVIFYFMAVPIGLLDALLVDQGVLVLKSFGAFIPGQLGIEEFSNKIMLSIIGIHMTGLWVAASILRRSRQIFWIVISGVLYLLIKQTKSPLLAIS